MIFSLPLSISCSSSSPKPKTNTPPKQHQPINPDEDKDEEDLVGLKPKTKTKIQWIWVSTQPKWRCWPSPIWNRPTDLKPRWTFYSSDSPFVEDGQWKREREEDDRPWCCWGDGHLSWCFSLYFFRFQECLSGRRCKNRGKRKKRGRERWEKGREWFPEYSLGCKKKRKREIGKKMCGWEKEG